MKTRVKKEATYERPSALSVWYRENLGPKVAITDIDWVITSIENRDKVSRYMIIEEKNVTSFEILLIGLGEARSLKEVREDITKENIPIFVVFVKDDVSQGVYVYEFEPREIGNRSKWVKLGDSWYVNVKDFSNFLTEEKFVDLIKRTIRVREEQNIQFNSKTGGGKTR